MPAAMVPAQTLDAEGAGGRAAEYHQVGGRSPLGRRRWLSTERHCHDQIMIELIFDASPDKQENVAELARRTTAATRREKGCILYRFTAGLDHPNRFILTELWESEEHLKAHFADGAFKSFWAELPGGGSFVSSSAWEGPLVPSIPPSPAH